MKIYKTIAPVRQHKQFTLIEMLIVIAIIGILAAMLMPALQSAVDTANKMSCQNNERQIGITEAVYTGEFNGFYPVDYENYKNANGVGTSNKYFKTVQIIIANYMGADQSDPYFDNNGPFLNLICPGMPDILTLKDLNSWNYNKQHYLFSGNVHGFPPVNNTKYNAQQMHSIRDTQVKYPSLCVLFSDTPYWKDRNPNDKLKMRYLDGGSFGNSYRLLYSPHNYLPNVLYADGHVASVERIDPSGTTVPSEAKTDYGVYSGTPLLGASNATVAAKHWNLIPGRPKKK